MRTTKILALCIAIAVLAYVAGTASMKAGPSNPNFIQRVQIEGIPTPQQMMRVVEGTPFSVPDRKIFVVTGLGSTFASDNGEIRIIAQFDSIDVMGAKLMDRHTDVPGVAGTSAIAQVPPGLVARAGVEVSCFDNNPSGSAVVLGYLVDE